MRPKTSTIVLLVVVFLALLILPPLGGPYYAYLFTLVCINIILAASLRPSLTCGQLNIGHSAFMSIGAYTSALLAKNLGLPFELALLCGAVLACVVGLGDGIPGAAAAGSLLCHGDGGYRGGDSLDRPALGATDPWHERVE